MGERGRSLAIVLFGAQRFPSAVRDRVTGNRSTRLLGRTSAAEMAERNYRFPDPDLKAADTRLEKGRLILNHAVFREPLEIKFPMVGCRQAAQPSGPRRPSTIPRAGQPDRACCFSPSR